MGPAPRDHPPVPRPRHPGIGPTLTRIRATLRAALNAAIRRGLISENAASKAELPRGRRPRAVLPADADIIAYCRGRYCVFAPDAVRLLRARGFSARLLAGGLPDWRLDGLPVAAEPAGR